MTKMIFLEFIINKVNEENAHKIRPLLNKILDDAGTAIGDKNNVNYQKIIQYIIVTNYMGDPTSPICIQETSGNNISGKLRIINTTIVRT